MHAMAAALVSPCSLHHPHIPTTEAVPASAAAAAAVVACARAKPLRKQSDWLGYRVWINEQQGRGISDRRVVAMASATAEPPAADVTTTAKGLQVREIDHDANSRVRLKVRVPGKLCKEIYDEILLDYSKKVKVKGFRPGKIPARVLLNQIGQKRIESEAVTSILEKTLPEAMASVAGRALTDTEEIVTKFDALLSAFQPTSPLSYVVAVDVIPDVKWVSEDAYKHLSIEVEARDAAAVQTAADVELELRHKDLGSLRVVTDRGIQMKDVTIIDVSATRINADGTEGRKILSCEQKGFNLDTEESASYIPGFVDGLIGMERGKTRSLDLVFPPDWSQEDLRGVRARFTVECKEVFYRVVPELNDEIAEKLYEGCTTLDQVKEALLKKHQLIEEKARKDAAKGAIVQQLAKITDMDLPNSLLEDQGRQMYATKLFELQVNQRLDKSQMAPLTSKEMVDNFLRIKRDEIVASVKQSLAVAEIFKLEKLQYSKEELEQEVGNAIAEFKRYNQEYDEEKVREQAQEVLEGTRVLDWLVEHADIKYRTKESR